MDKLNRYLELKDLRKEALKSKKIELADQYLEQMDQIYSQLTVDERNITFVY